MDILVIYTIIVATSFGATEIIYAGKGWNEKGTFVVVPDPVTWYAAAESDFGKNSINRGNLLKHIAIYISSNGYVNDPLVWIGAITSEKDGLLYNVRRCEANDNSFGPYTCGERKCLALNVTGASQKSSLQFAYDDCMNHHPYMSYSLDDNHFLEETRQNITVQVHVDDHIDIQSTILEPNFTQSCYSHCQHAMQCVASFFDFETNVCLLYVMELHEDIADKQEFTLTKNSSVFTEFSWKTWQRAFLDLGTFSGQDRSLDDRLFTCFDDQQLNEDACKETKTPCGALATTSNQICKWLCYENISTILTDEDIKAIKDEIKKELQVDKSTLSSTKRKLISVRDSRPSAQAIGWLGGLFLGLFVAAITVSDAPYFYLVLKKHYLNLKKRAKIKSWSKCNC